MTPPFKRRGAHQQRNLINLACVVQRWPLRASLPQLVYNLSRKGRYVTPRISSNLWGIHPYSCGGIFETLAEVILQHMLEFDYDEYNLLCLFF